MSATISKNKLKFSVFGRGFEDERSDSGEGVDTDSLDIPFRCNSALIDTTSTYIWLVKSTDGGIYKYDLATMTEVSQTAVPSGGHTYSPYLIHPSNTDNNIGIAMVFDNGASKSYWYFFDMTDDTLIGTCELAGWKTPAMADAIIVGNKVHVCERAYLRTNPTCYHVNLDDMSITLDQTSGIASCGFVDEDTIYAYYPPEWFYQTKKNYGKDLVWNTVWECTASQGGGSGFPNIDQAGFCGNGFVYLPTKKNGAWRFGVYNGNSYSDYNTPKCIRTFGKFDSVPSISKAPVYTNEKTRICFATNSKLYVTDTEDVELITDGNYVPYCMNDNYIIADNQYNKTSIFKYR